MQFPWDLTGDVGTGLVCINTTIDITRMIDFFLLHGPSPRLSIVLLWFIWQMKKIKLSANKNFDIIEVPPSVTLLFMKNFLHEKKGLDR